MLRRNYFFRDSSTATATETVIPTMGLLPAPRKPRKQGFRWVKSSKGSSFYNILIVFSLDQSRVSAIVCGQMWTKIFCPHRSFIIADTQDFARASFALFRHKPFSIALNHQLLSTIQKNHQLYSRYHRLSVNFVSSINIIKELLEIGNHIRRRYNLCHFAEAAEPTIELVTDCNFGIHNDIHRQIHAIRSG